MKEIRNKVLKLIDKYQDQLAAKGIEIVLSKKYTEETVGERSSSYAYSGSVIINSIERALDKKREAEKGYHFEPNKWHSLVLTIVPLDKKLVHRTSRREYAFVLKQVVRSHVGEKPVETVYQEEKVLQKIEKTILKILKKADKMTAQQVCKDTFRDAFRYSFLSKYGYKDNFCGKDRFTWDMIFLFLAVAICVGIIVIAWAITNLI